MWIGFLLFLVGMLVHLSLRYIDWYKKQEALHIRTGEGFKAVKALMNWGMWLEFFQACPKLTIGAVILASPLYFMWFNGTQVMGAPLTDYLEYSPAASVIFGYVSDSLVKHLLNKFNFD